MTASALEGDREACFAGEMADYVSKPVRSEDLKRALSESPDPVATGLPIEACFIARQDADPWAVSSGVTNSLPVSNEMTNAHAPSG